MLELQNIYTERIAGAAIVLSPALIMVLGGLLLGTLLIRYVGVSRRLRAISHERSGLLQNANTTPWAGALDIERLEQLDSQMPQLLRRRHLIHDSLLLVICSILVVVLGSSALATATVLGADWLTSAVPVLSGISSCTLLTGLLMTCYELRIARSGRHRPMVTYRSVRDEERA